MNVGTTMEVAIQDAVSIKISLLSLKLQHRTMHMYV